MEMSKMANEFNLNEFVNEPKFPFLSINPSKALDFLILDNVKNVLLRKVKPGNEDRVKTYLKGIVGETLIEHLPIKFACNAFDLVSGKEIVFERGMLYKAMRATMAFPFILEPARFDDQILLDGGILDNAPVGIAKKLGAKITILVDIHKPIREMPKERCKNTFNLVQRMIEAMMANSTEEKIKDADFIIRIKLDFDILDFSEPQKIIEEGEKVTAENIQIIRRLIT
jgi:NTE family protein